MSIIEARQALGGKAHRLYSSKDRFDRTMWITYCGLGGPSVDRMEITLPLDGVPVEDRCLRCWAAWV